MCVLVSFFVFELIPRTLLAIGWCFLPGLPIPTVVSNILNEESKRIERKGKNEKEREEKKKRKQKVKDGNNERRRGIRDR